MRYDAQFRDVFRKSPPARLAGPESRGDDLNVVQQLWFGTAYPINRLVKIAGVVRVFPDAGVHDTKFTIRARWRRHIEIGGIEAVVDRDEFGLVFRRIGIDR